MMMMMIIIIILQHLFPTVVIFPTLTYLSLFVPFQCYFDSIHFISFYLFIFFLLLLSSIPFVIYLNKLLAFFFADRHPFLVCRIVELLSKTKKGRENLFYYYINMRNLSVVMNLLACLFPFVIFSFFGSI